MTKTHQLLDLMLSGKPLTYQKIRAETGWTLEEAKKVIHTMTTAGYCKHIPLSFVITQAGIERQKVSPKTPQQNIDKRVEQRRLKREREEIEKKKHDVETTVQQAMRTQPNCVFGLGAM